MPRPRNHDDIAAYHDYDVHIPTRTVYLGSQVHAEGNEEPGVDYVVASKLSKNMHILNTLSDDPIKVIVNSIGGDFYHMLAIYGSVKRSKAHVTMLVEGIAASAGCVILQAADSRQVDERARLMIHYVQGTYDAETEALNTIMEDIFLLRIREKHPKFHREKLKQMMTKETWLDAHQACALGLADEVV